MGRTRSRAALAVCAWLSACAARTPLPRPEPALSTPPLRAPSPPLREPLIVRDVGFEGPESALYDPASDLYLISNVVGGPLERDDRAFISRVRPDGSVSALKWIDAARPEVELDAPKGMALIGDVLYVADIQTVRKFDRETGAALGAILIHAASFLHDLSADSEGTVYISDSGLGAGLSGSGGDAVYRIARDGSVRTLRRSRELGQPSGVANAAEGLWVASFAAGELYLLGADGARREVLKPPKGSLDGVASCAGHLYVSSWEAGAVYERLADGFVERVAGIEAPADLAVDPLRERLLITHYHDHALSIHQLEL